MHGDGNEEARSSWRRNKASVSVRFAETTTVPVQGTGELILGQSQGSLEGEDQACVWDAARAMCMTMDALLPPRAEREGLRAIEIGAGTGACGLAAALLGVGHVILTDVEDLLPLLGGNIRRNGLGPKAEARRLEWGRDDPPIAADIVIACEVAYAVHEHENLVQALNGACTPSGCVLLGHERRWRDVDSWFHDEVERFFSVKCFPRSELIGPASWDDDLAFFRLLPSS